LTWLKGVKDLVDIVDEKQRIELGMSALGSEADIT
jgi:hypothetical protein